MAETSLPRTPSPPDWLATYSSNLTQRNELEGQYKTFIDAFTALNARRAPPTHTTPSTSSGVPAPISPATTTPSAEVQSLRTALTTTQTTLTASTARLSSLTTQHAIQTATLSTLRATLTTTQHRLADREDEARQKSRLLLSLQDEQVALTLALNLAEEREQKAHEDLRIVEMQVRKLRAENEELVRRWVARVGEEAEIALGQAEGR